jgi:hypothetical protein
LAPAAQPLADHAISSYLFSGGLGIGGPNTSHPHNVLLAKYGILSFRFRYQRPNHKSYDNVGM